MAGVAAASAIAGAGISAYGQLQQGKSQAQSDMFNAAIARQNAAFDIQQANITAQAGDQEVSGQEMANAAKYGATKAHQGASGFTVNSGSNADVLAGERETGQLDAMTIRSNAMKKAYGYQVEAVGENQQAILKTKAAKNAIKSSQIEAVGTLIGAGGKLGMLEGSSDPFESYKNKNSLNLGN